MWDIGPYASKVFQVVPFRAMKASGANAVKHIALPETTTRGIPKQWIISSFTNFTTSSAVGVAGAFAISQTVR